MRVLFYVWGWLGFLANLIILYGVGATVFDHTTAAAEASALLLSALVAVLIWIGGTLFFGLAAILSRPSDMPLISK